MNLFSKGIYKDLVDDSYVRYLRDRNRKALNLDAVEERVETIVETEEEYRTSDEEYDIEWRKGLGRANDDGYWPNNPNEMLKKPFDPGYRDLELPDTREGAYYKGTRDPNLHGWIYDSDVQPILGIRNENVVEEKPVSRQIPERSSKPTTPISTTKNNDPAPNGLHDIILNSDKTSLFVNKAVHKANPVQEPITKPAVNLKAEPITINNTDKLNGIKELLHIGQYVADYHKKGGPVLDIHPEYQPALDPVINKPRNDLEYRRINENNFLHKEAAEIVTRDQRKKLEDDSNSGEAKKNRLKGLH